MDRKGIKSSSLLDNNFGLTPLMIVVMSNNKDLNFCKLLVENGAFWRSYSRIYFIKKGWFVFHNKFI